MSRADPFVMERVKHIFIVTCLVIFFLQAVYSTMSEGRKCYSTFKKLNGLSNHQKRSRLIGDPYQFAAKCNNIIPENSNILFLSNPSNNKPSYDLYLNYYLYPRKLFWLNDVAPYLEPPPKIEALDHTFLRGKNIDCIIFRYPKEYGLNQVIKLENGRAVKSFNLN
jgi:hypothetical protein